MFALVSVYCSDVVTLRSLAKRNFSFETLLEVHLLSIVQLYRRFGIGLALFSVIDFVWMQDTGEILMPQDMLKCQTYASKKITFETGEVTEMKCFGSPGYDQILYKNTGLASKCISNKVKFHSHFGYEYIH